MSVSARVLAVLLVSLALVSTTSAQSNLATVTGVVTDSADAVIPAAMVNIRNPGTNIEREISTNEVGAYTITNLIPVSTS